MIRALTTVVLCLAAAALIGNLAVVAIWLNGEAKKERAEEGGDDDRVKAASFLEQHGRSRVVALNAKLAESYGLETEAARPYTWQEHVTVYGRVVPNPRATYEVRAPFAGTVQGLDGRWPALGETVRPGQPLGRLVIRVGPQERLDLENRLTEARLKRKGAEEVRDLRQAVVDRLKEARNTVVAERLLDEAKVQLADARTQAETAKANEELLRQALEEIRTRGGGSWSVPLKAPAEKGLTAALEVSELAAQPGTAVEAGCPIARLVDVSRPLVRLDLPVRLGSPDLPGVGAASRAAPGEARLGSPDLPAEIDLSAASASTPPVKAKWVGPAAQVDAASQLRGAYYRIVAPATPWRPGVFVQARLPRPGGETQEAVTVPATALLHHQGRTLVYVSLGSGKYEKREVQVLGHDGDRCVLAVLSPLQPIGISPGDVVVTQQAQVLLSTEFREDSDND